MDKETRILLAGIHQEYVKNLPNRIEKIELQGQKVFESIADTNSLTLFYRDVHDLSGSSGTHGYKTMSKLLRQLDEILSNSLKTGGSVDKQAAGILLVQIKESSQIPPETPEMFKSF